MSKIVKVIFTISLIFFQLSSIKAQTTDNVTDTIPKNNKFQFPSLEAVIDSVIKNSGMVKFRNKHIGVMESTLASERIYWTRNFGIQGDVLYGNLNNFATNSDGVSSTAALTTSRQVNYSFGVYLKFPIFDFLNRKNQIKLAELEVDEAKHMAEFQKQEIRQTVIRMYQDMLLKRNVLKIRAKSLADAKVNKQMVEKEFRNGVVAVSEYVRITNITSNIEAEYEKAISEFITVKKMLEDMAGFVFGLTN